MESKQYPKSICDVVTQSKQFSWYKNKSSFNYDKQNITEVKAWNKAAKIATKVLADFVNDKKDPTHGALFYHNNTVNPNWASPQYITTVIGTHTFYNQAVVTITSR